jgi:DNA-binding transcriptional LysR family regulator
MNLNYLTYFMDLAKTLNFGQTAKNLSIAQPAVSRAIKNLEQQLQTTLFWRDNKRVALSPSGKKLYDQLQSPWSYLQNIIQESLEQQNTLNGKIRIATLHELGEYKIVPLIHHFTAQYPGIEIELIYGGNQEINQLLAAGEVDFTFGLSPLDRENIYSFPLLKQSSFLVSANKLPKQLHPKDMEFVLYRHNDPLLEQFLSTYYPKFSMGKIKKKMILNSHNAIVMILEKRPGLFAVLPEMSIAVAKALKEKRIHVIGKKSLQTNIYFNYWNQEFPTRRDKTFQEFTKQLFKSK